MLHEPKLRHSLYTIYHIIYTSLNCVVVYCRGAKYCIILNYISINTHLIAIQVISPTEVNKLHSTIDLK